MILSRIKENVLIDPRGCWIWLKSLDGKGYGRVSVRGRIKKTHVAAFVERYGEPPAGTVLDHVVCQTRHCCNPEHLEPVPGVVNTRRGASLTNAKREQTHCVRGHELAGENVILRRDRNTRECRACKVLRRKVLAKGVVKCRKLDLGLPEDWNDHTPDRGPQ